jgi:hypothetical protein
MNLHADTDVVVCNVGVLEEYIVNLIYAEPAYVMVFSRNISLVGFVQVGKRYSI